MLLTPAATSSPVEGSNEVETEGPGGDEVKGGNNLASHSLSMLSDVVGGGGGDMWTKLLSMMAESEARQQLSDSPPS